MGTVVFVIYVEATDVLYNWNVFAVFFLKSDYLINLFIWVLWVLNLIY